jgi:dipeptidyl aminopeptidase/acylaminoacyl peptidase
MRHNYVLTLVHALLFALVCPTSAVADKPPKAPTKKPPVEGREKSTAEKKAARKAEAKPNAEAKSPEKSESDSPPSAKAKGHPKEKTKKKKRSPKRPIAPSDYAQWERLDQNKLSHDGQWLLHGVKRVDGEGTLTLHRVKGTKASEEATYKQGLRPVFSKDSKWLAVTIGKSPAEVKKAKASKAPPSGSVIHLRRLENGETTEFKDVRGVTFSNDSRFAAIEVTGKPVARPPSRPGSPPSKPASSGTSKALLIRNLAAGTDTTFGNVTRFSWSDRGSLLAMVIDSPSISNSLQLFDPASGILKTLETDDQNYTGLVWRKDSFDLAAMREFKHADKEDVSHILLAWRALDQDQLIAEKFVYDHSSENSFSRDHYLVSGLRWSHDGSAIYCSVKNWVKKPKDFPTPPEPSKASKKKKKKKKKKGKGKAEPAEGKKAATEKPPSKKAEDEKPSAPTLRTTVKTPSNVEVWHSKDATIMPRQKKEAGAKKNPNRSAVWWPAQGRLVQLENDLTERVQILRSGKQAIGIDATPHDRTAMFGPRLQNIYTVNTRNGKRERILEGVKYTLSTSPNGRYLLFLREGEVWSHDLRNGKQRNLCDDLDVHFTNQQDDTLAVEKRPFGSGTWLTDSSAVLLYDRFDIWLLAPDGSRAVKLTDGRKNLVRHRLSQASLHHENDSAISPKQTLYIALYGERTKKSGYARLSLNDKSKRPRKLETLLWDDMMVHSLARARDAEIYTLSMERNDLSRDLYLAGPTLENPRKVSKTNEFQKQFRWGHSELIDYQNKHGVNLQGSLIYPANYKRGRKYPMIVYIYEKRSQELHRYYTPSEKHPYNPCVFSAEGYFVFQPDIVYRPQEPGISAVECVVPAVKKVLETGMVDPKRVGLMGHSWGAYQTAFIVTQTDLFAAGVAGAPLTDMMSMSVSVYWNSGNTNALIFAQSQGRMNKPFWRDVETYARNSPIHGLDSLNTPLLIAFGDDDGAVDWDQGVEMYNAARWAGIEDLVMLVYPGENHGLRKEENMVDYHYRVKEWMAHYVKGAEPETPKWITEGKSFLEREKEKEDLKNKKPAPKPAPADKKPEKNKPEVKKTEDNAGKDRGQAEQAKSAPADSSKKKPGRKPRAKEKRSKPNTGESAGAPAVLNLPGSQ